MDRKRKQPTQTRYLKDKKRGKKFIPPQETQVMFDRKYWFTVNSYPYDAISPLHFLVSPKNKKKLNDFELHDMQRYAHYLFPKANVFYNDNINRSVQYHDHLHVVFPSYEPDIPDDEAQALHIASLTCLTEWQKIYVLRAVRRIWGFK